MKSAIRYMASNHVAANLLMLVLIVGGLLVGLRVKQEVFPEVTLDRVQVSVAYPGAGPEEVEEGIILKIEENLTGVDGIKEITAVAAEGQGVVTAELRTGEDPDRLLQEIKSEVDRISTFPEDAERPVISRVSNRRQVISVVVHGNIGERGLRELAEQVQDDLLQLPQVTQADLAGVRAYEIAVEVSEENLRRYGLTLDRVAQRIRAASLDLPGGTVRTRGGEVLVRTKERRYTGPQYAEIRIITLEDGTEIRLGDIATVKDAFAESDIYASFDGRPAAMVQVYRVGDQTPKAVARAVLAYVEAKNRELPESVRLGTWNDRSELLKSRMDLLIKNAALGLVLVAIILGLFLEIRLALWVMLGIPISFLGAMLFMPSLDVSINMISLFAFIMALGIVVDDAIVVGENVYEHRRRGEPYLEAAQKGALEVAKPVVFAILTSVAAFAPLLNVSGSMGKFIYVIPTIVIAILVFSLVESLFVLPAHLGHSRPLNGNDPLSRLRRRVGRGLDSLVNGPFKRLLGFCLEYRYLTIAVAMVWLMVTVGLVGGGVIKFRFMPQVDGDTVRVNLEMPPGTPVERTTALKERIAAAGLAVARDYDSRRAGKPSILRNLYAAVGESAAGRGPNAGRGNSGGNVASLTLFLQKSEDRGIPAAEIARAWQQTVGEIAGAESLTFESNLFSLGANVDIRLAHESFEVLENASERVRTALAAYSGVFDIADNHSRGKQELKITLRPEARTLGITEQELGRQLRGAFYGAEALRLQRGRNEVKVMVRYPLEDRRALGNLEAMYIRTADGGEVPLAQAANVQPGFGFATINRTDRKRVINVTAGVDDRQANAEEILAELKTGLLPALISDYPGLTFDLEGEEKERKESIESMRRGFTLALLVIFALLAVTFRSYTQPLLVMSAIPFGIVGAVMGHLLLGFNFSILSLFGIVALAGVVVNDSLLLIDYANRQVRSGCGLFEAIQRAGMRRFRPILLTSLTTFFGLMPMILETSVQAQFLIPMAISLAFGILFATGITLLLVPALFLVLEDFRGLLNLRAVQEVKLET